MVVYLFTLSEQEFQLCYNFSKGSSKTQRENRSGGTKKRSLDEIEEDTMRGKVAEVVSKRFFEQEPLNYTGIKLDFDIYPRGKWDEQDFTIGSKKLQVKSAKWFSNWLLLESKDIERGVYDYYILLTIEKDFKSGKIRGFATRDEILKDENTLKLKKGDLIPGTNTILDADNHARHSKFLHNSEKEWLKLLEECKA